MSLGWLCWCACRCRQGAVAVGAEVPILRRPVAVMMGNHVAVLMTAIEPLSDRKTGAYRPTWGCMLGLSALWRPVGLPNDSGSAECDRKHQDGDPQVLGLPICAGYERDAWSKRPGSWRAPARWLVPERHSRVGLCPAGRAWAGEHSDRRATSDDVPGHRARVHWGGIGLNGRTGSQASSASIVLRSRSADCRGGGMVRPAVCLAAANPNGESRI